MEPKVVKPANLSDLRPQPLKRTSLTVFVEKLAIEAYIGVHAHERGRSQRLNVDVEVELALGQVEHLPDTLDYERIAERARAIADADHVDLVEDFADRLGRALFEDNRVLKVRIRVRKPRAIEGADAAGCEAVYTRE